MKILLVSELILKSLPLTGASSLNPSSSSSSSSSSQQQLLLSNSSLSSSSSDSRILTCLNHPTLLVGAINLPTSSSCGNGNGGGGCLTFSDGSASLCCTLLDQLDLSNIIGKQIHILSWNFIPHFKNCAGFLEILTWTLPPHPPPPPPPHPAPPQGDSRLCHLHGTLLSVSPVSVVPCANSHNPNSNSTNLTGFLAQLSVCNCELCISSKPPSLPHNYNTHHTFTLYVTLYFFGPSLSWHPLLSKLLHNLVCITALKKKMVFIGKLNSCLMFTTTHQSTFHILSPPLQVQTCLPYPTTLTKGKGEFGAYSGIVTGVYMQGMLVELDEKVCLLLTDPLLAPPHLVRVGALISLRNVHFVHPNFSWTRMLLLGACCKTSINVKSFSPLKSRCNIRSQTQSLLGKFIESLVFSARFWLLLTITNFKKKFATFFSEKEILGSKHKEGLAQMYAKFCLPLCVTRPRHGVFMEFCNHDLCGCGNEPNYCDPKLAVPISILISHCEVLWLTLLLQTQNDYKMNGKNNLLSCEGKSYSRLVRRIISSKDLGAILIGTLQTSSSSGRLQLVDSSGSIDVVIPDRPSNCDASYVYEVRYYNIVIEGLPAEVDAFSLPKTESFSLRSIFNHGPSNREIKPSAIYVHFYMRDVTCLNICFDLPSMHWSDNLMVTKDAMFHLLLVTHKFPAMQTFQFQGDASISNKPSFFVEAMILPWNLIFPREHQIDFSIENLKKNAAKKKIVEDSCRKRHKLSNGSSNVLNSILEDNLAEASNLCLPHELPCLVLVRDFDAHSQARPGVLLRDKHDVVDGLVAKENEKKILLEFKFEIFSNYELLQVGGYYMMQYAKEELPQNVKDHNRVAGGKILVTSETPLCSLTFSCDEPDELLQNEPLQPASIKTDTVPSECSPTGELFFQQSQSQSSEAHSHDINLHLSVDAMNLLKVAMDTLEDEFIKPTYLSSAADMYTCTGTIMDSGVTNPDCRLPKGTLISLHGHIVDVHSFSCYSDASCEGTGDIHWMRFFHGVPSSICIHLSREHGIVSLRGNLSKQYPIGIGPGVKATFHRVLVVGQYELMLTPVSFIVINSIKEVFPYNGGRHSYLEFGSDILNVFNMVSSSLISEFFRSLETKPMRFSCRLVAIHVLVLEKQKCNFGNTDSGEQSKGDALNVPFAGFILDDGSSTCCCWASADRAETLLRLHETTVINAHHSNGWRLKRGRPNRTQRTAYHYLNRILNKHSRIIVKNYGSMIDSSSQDLKFFVNSDNGFSSSDENLLKLISTNACCGSVLSVVGSAMDSNATTQLEKDLGITTECMQNIWAREVVPINHLTEARGLIQELAN